MKIRCVLVFVFGLTMTSISSAQKPSVDVIFINGKVYTGKSHMIGRVGLSGLSEGFEVLRVHALAVSVGRIIAAGSNEEVQKLKGPNTQEIGRAHVSTPVT